MVPTLREVDDDASAEGPDPSQSGWRGVSGRSRPFAKWMTSGLRKVPTLTA